MKKIFILSMAAFLVFGLTSLASADFTNPYTVGFGPAQFYAIDNLGTSGDGNVTLTNLSSTPGYSLQYSLGSGTWTSIDTGSNFTVTTGTDHHQLVQLRLSPLTGTGDPITKISYMTFSGQYAPDSSLYNSVFLFFSSQTFASRISFLTPGGTDHVSPVPIPAAVWLLGSGLIGIVAIRRRFSN